VDWTWEVVSVGMADTTVSSQPPAKSSSRYVLRPSVLAAASAVQRQLTGHDAVSLSDSEFLLFGGQVGE
jgi:hypothetical protein